MPHLVLASRVGIWAVLLSISATAAAQPFQAPAPKGTALSDLGFRHPTMPSWKALYAEALDAQTAMIPSHGGIDERGMPAWSHQVRRRCAVDSTQWFNGWVKLYVTQPTQAWRFQRFESGWLKEQVGFHANGIPEQHLHRSAEGKHVGSQRLWFENGLAKTDQFHDEQGRLHGWQRQWKPDGQLDWNIRFEHGVELDSLGHPVPENKRTKLLGSDDC